MKLTIKGDPKEIAALVWELQERQVRYEDFLPVVSRVCLRIAEAIGDTGQEVPSKSSN